MWKLFQIELYKIFRRPRTYISFIAVSALIFVVQIGLKADGQAYIDFVLSGVKNNINIEGHELNGYFVCYVILQLLLVHVPLLIALVAADMISGEANMGTLRLMVTKPVSREQFVLAKFLASAVYTLALLIWIAIIGLFLSMWIFGVDDLLVAKPSYLVQLAGNDVFWRYCGAFCFAYLAMLTVAAVGFFLSIFAENSIGPIVATMSVVIFFTIISTMSIPIFQKIQPYLFTTHMVNWKDFFDEKVTDDNTAIIGSIQNPQRIITSAIILLAHIVGLVGLSMYLFKKKDVLS